MLVTLEVETGPSTGRRIWLRSNELAQFGRTEWTDFAVPSDAHLADVHFAVFVNGTECRVRDLQSPGGTFVNGTPVRECVLHGGDRIRAGSTFFRVAIDGEAAEADKDQPSVDKPFHYRYERSPGDLTVYIGDEKAPSAADMAHQLAQQSPIYLVTRFGGSHRALPAELARSSDYVTVTANHHWYRFFPLLVASEEMDSFAELIDEAWADDSVVCVVASDRSKPQLLAHMRAHAASFSGADVLREQLNCCPTGFVADLLDGLSAVMLKDIETGSWRLYLNESSETPWQDLGFACPPSPQNEHSTLTSA